MNTSESSTFVDDWEARLARLRRDLTDMFGDRLSSDDHKELDGYRLRAYFESLDEPDAILLASLGNIDVAREELALARLARMTTEEDDA